MRSQTPQMGSEASHAASPPRHGRQTPQQQHRAQSPQLHEPPREQNSQLSWPLNGQQPHIHEHRQVREEPPPRADAASPTLYQQPPARNSIAKLPLDDDEDSSNPRPLRSIFPTYNPDLPLNRQEYAPTAKSPTHVPRAVISRQSYHQPVNHNDEENPYIRSPAHSPRANEEANHRWARPRPSEAPAVPTPCTNDQLKSFWKVANGWKASSSEGRVYCMKLTQEKDAPVYTLSSSTHPFYNIRLDPTSASARVTVKRHDPNKPYKEPRQEEGSSSSSIIGGGTSPIVDTPSGKITDGKHWHEAITTTTEEEARKHHPEDGLVALLMPTPATKMATEKPNDETAQVMAERECARLVWDDDSESYFLVHAALAKPFCVTIERSPAWSRVEYTLEHHESPKHLAKLTRDSTGGGWLEVDTGLASKIEAYYIVDVAITALMLVSSADEKNQPDSIEAFEPPPIAPPPAVLAARSASGKESPLGKLVGAGKKKSKMESFEIDLESQDDSLGGKKGNKDRVKVKEGIDKLPFVIRIPVKMVKAVFKCIIWFLTMIFKCLRFMFGGCYKLVGSKY